mmetsp:Transcript_76562/g.127635  ORF Transcript_76562/g.127635 Transcript_76562/m.127635 type:complete len:337 (-) Transcript_76562:148-1158(-)
MRRFDINVRRARPVVALFIVVVVSVRFLEAAHVFADDDASLWGILNRRFRAGLQQHTSIEPPGVFIHQFDGTEDPEMPWRPCPRHDVKGPLFGPCAQPGAQLHRDQFSASVIFADLFRPSREDRKSIPLFSFDGGFVLRPSLIKLLCAFARDAGSGWNGVGACHAAYGSACVPGCGNPPRWCGALHQQEANGHRCCAYGKCPGPPYPWRPEELVGMLKQHAELGETFKGIGTYTGYNEVILESDNFVDHLPYSVEAIFITDCLEGQQNSRMSFSTSCAGAHAHARSLHHNFTQEYGLDEETFPLLRLSPISWKEPFTYDSDWLSTEWKSQKFYGLF